MHLWLDLNLRNETEMRLELDKLERENLDLKRAIQIVERERILAQSKGL